MSLSRRSASSPRALLYQINGGQLRGFTNLLINPYGRFNQRAPATNADNTYGHDRWVALTQTDTIAVATLTDLENGMPRAWKITQSQVAAQRMGYAQWIEGANCKHLRGNSVTLSGRIRYSLNAAVRYAVCEWTGTEDTLSTARDPVNDWTSGTYTTGNFFKSTTFNVLGVGAITPSASIITDLVPLTVAVGSSANNLLVFFWTEGTAAQNAVLAAAPQLEVGTVASTREIRPVGIEFLLCQRYCFQTDGIDKYPGQCYSGTLCDAVVTYPVTMRAAPSLTVVTNGSVQTAAGGSQAVTWGSTALGTDSSTLRGTAASGLAAGNATLTTASAQFLFDADL